MYSLHSYNKSERFKNPIVPYIISPLFPRRGRFTALFDWWDLLSMGLIKD